MSLPSYWRLPYLPLALVPLLFLVGAGWRPMSPAVATLSKTTIARSGRLIIQGAGFGDL